MRLTRPQGCALSPDSEVATRTSPATLNRDAGTRLALEDALDSPLPLLDLVDRVDAQHRRSVPAPRPRLPPEIFAFAVAEFLRALDVHQRDDSIPSA